MKKLIALLALPVGLAVQPVERRAPRDVAEFDALFHQVSNWGRWGKDAGVLLDIPRLKGVDFLEPGTAVHVEDVEAWEKKTGRWLRRARGIAIVGSDAAEDVIPSRVEGIALPVHTLLITGMGMPLLDNQDLEAVAETAAAPAFR